MSIDDALAKLAAGLAQDEAVALELTEFDRWQGVLNLTMEIGDGTEDRVARFSPARVLGQVEEIRKIAEYAPYAQSIAYDQKAGDPGADVVAASDSGYRLGQWHAYKAVLEALAGIYTGDNAETGKL